MPFLKDTLENKTQIVLMIIYFIKILALFSNMEISIDMALPSSV